MIGSGITGLSIGRTEFADCPWLIVVNYSLDSHNHGVCKERA